MKLIIDRIEGAFAVCEDENRKMMDIPLNELPENCKEGTALLLEDGHYLIDAKTANERHAKIKNTMDRLWKNS